LKTSNLLEFLKFYYQYGIGKGNYMFGGRLLWLIILQLHQIKVKIKHRSLLVLVVCLDCIIIMLVRLLWG